LTTAQQLSDSLVVVIDVLRASTTILQALASGAASVVPCLEVDEARRRAAEIGSDRCLLGGERGGVPIQGFQLGNSPADYTPQHVAGRQVVFTTTNGTKAMVQCRQARDVVIGSFANLSAVVEHLEKPGRLPPLERIDLLCAGTADEVSLEDALLAGALVDRLARGSADYQPNDQALLVRDAWNAASREPLADVLARGRGGQNLCRLGLEADIRFAARIDRWAIVPRLDLEQWAMRVA
jgi:2-phosphosulfolactate phosphatase